MRNHSSTGALSLSRGTPLSGAVSPAPLPRENGGFCTTHWTLVLQAASPSNPNAADAFAGLYSDYWYPIYAYLRRREHSSHQAEDLAQEFFLHLIEKQSLAGFQREGGRFRSFLLRSLDNFLRNEWNRASAQKRGGGARHISIEALADEQRFELESHDSATPESVFQRNWAHKLIENAMRNLRAELEEAGKAALFEDLRPHLQSDRLGVKYAEIAARHGFSEGAIKVAVHRLRRRCGELLRAEIARTVASGEEVEDELRHLLDVVSR